ncbi:hypothetical protein HK099_001734 [Clydaea vesicula]|uniref:INTS8 TPR repeats domain-containing protein n=1 Tax=Clydaea vesicula TaxID=447962 RepID=A0AAD5U694_9FUNG|nr:hypothetical protein HK099_001734 [Clydaea vesicula]
MEAEYHNYEKEITKISYNPISISDYILNPQKLEEVSAIQQKEVINLLFERGDKNRLNDPYINLLSSFCSNWDLDKIEEYFWDNSKIPQLLIAIAKFKVKNSENKPDFINFWRHHIRICSKLCNECNKSAIYYLNNALDEYSMGDIYGSSNVDVESLKEIAFDLANYYFCLKDYTNADKYLKTAKEFNFDSERKLERLTAILLQDQKPISSNLPIQIQVSKIVTSKKFMEIIPILAVDVESIKVGSIVRNNLARIAFKSGQIEAAGLIWVSLAIAFVECNAAKNLTLKYTAKFKLEDENKTNHSAKSKLEEKEKLIYININKFLEKICLFFDNVEIWNEIYLIGDLSCRKGVELYKTKVSKPKIPESALPIYDAHQFKQNLLTSITSNDSEVLLQEINATLISPTVSIPFLSAQANYYYQKVGIIPSPFSFHINLKGEYDKSTLIFDCVTKIFKFSGLPGRDEIKVLAFQVAFSQALDTMMKEVLEKKKNYNIPMDRLIGYFDISNTLYNYKKVLTFLLIDFLKNPTNSTGKSLLLSRISKGQNSLGESSHLHIHFLSACLATAVITMDKFAEKLLIPFGDVYVQHKQIDTNFDFKLFHSISVILANFLGDSNLKNVEEIQDAFIDILINLEDFRLSWFTGGILAACLSLNLSKSEQIDHANFGIMSQIFLNWPADPNQPIEKFNQKKKTLLIKFLIKLYTKILQKLNSDKLDMVQNTLYTVKVLNCLGDLNYLNYDFRASLKNYFSVISLESNFFCEGNMREYFAAKSRYSSRIIDCCVKLEDFFSASVFLQFMEKVEYQEIFNFIKSLMDTKDDQFLETRIVYYFDVSVLEFLTKKKQYQNAGKIGK